MSKIIMPKILVSQLMAKTLVSEMKFLAFGI